MTISLAETSRSRRSLAISILLWLVVTVFVILLCFLGYWYHVADAALPQVDGKIQVAGLSVPVHVIRDARGVPTIDANSLQDLFFAQGYVTAQDRLWQMDIMRRFASGDLSEILGPDLLKFDREQRILGLRAAAQQSWQMATPRDREFFEAYARGVNAGIGSHRDRLPLEFRLLHYIPKPWTPVDSIVIANQMVKDLNYQHSQPALAREKILAKLGPEMTGQLFVNRSWHDRPPTVMREDLTQPSNERNHPQEEDEDSDNPDNSVTHSEPAERGEQYAIPVDGSNDWVISGAHTVTGKPLLSNDMHLSHQMPNLWYEAHLRAANVDVVGVTLPGMPFVIVGHNQRIAWGFTNVGPTVTDLYIENVNAQGEYQTPQGWKQPVHRTEVIHVKGQPDVTIDVKITRHGPIITSLLAGETRQIALRWTLYDGLRVPFFDIDTAQNWDDFRKAFSLLDAPGQNVVYADVDGNIGYQTTGKVPIRAAGDGSLPVSGADDAHEWIGYIPFDQLPSIYDPPSGIIATANGRIAPDGYRYSISTEWEAPWRTARVYHVLESGRKFAPSDMLGLQNDIHSDPDQFAAERLVYAVDHAAHPSVRARQAADILRSWDGRMEGASAAPTITEVSMRELQRLILEPLLGPAPSDREKREETLNWTTYSWLMDSVWLENVLLHRPAQWLPAKYPNYDELLTAAVESALNLPKAPKELSTWRWGKFNAVYIQNPVLGKIPLLNRWTGPGINEQSGSGFTVKAVSRLHGPSERFTANLADLDQSTLNLVTGESGNFLSPNYMDQWKAWYGGTTFALPFSEQAISRMKKHELELDPAQ